jgi:uroporphyrinogen decarboxylase
MKNLKEYFMSFERFPVIPILGYPALPALNISTQECLFSPEKHCKVAKYLLQEYEVDAILPLLDLTVEAEALGAQVKYTAYEAPQIAEHAENITSRETEKMKAYIQTVEKLRGISRGTPVGAYVTGPFTAAGQVIGIQKLIKQVYIQEEMAKETLERVVETIQGYGEKIEEAGADFIIVAEPTSSLLSPEQFKKHSKPYIKKVIGALKIETILHICGKARHLLKEVQETGAAGVSVDQNIPLQEAAKTLPENILILGNYPPTNLAHEKPSIIKENVEKMLEPVKEHKNIIASTGCDIPAKTPPENIKTFIQTAKNTKRK